MTNLQNQKSLQTPSGIQKSATGKTSMGKIFSFPTGTNPDENTLFSIKKRPKFHKTLDF